MALNFPNINPIILDFGILKVTWYSLSYIVGIILGYFYVLYLNKLRKIKLDKQKIEDSITYLVLGIIFGGRLGYVLFYKPLYYLDHPLEALKTWEGGMSFHGAMIGVGLSIYIFSKINKIGYLYFLDYLACTAPIGICFGRVTNFINDELYGRVTNVSWAVLFPRGGYLPRHPSQLYESFLEGFLLFIILSLIFIKTKYRNAHGFIAGIFLILYGTIRCLLEFFREPDDQLGYFADYFSMGQLLSLPLILLGVFFVIYSISKKELYV